MPSLHESSPHLLRMGRAIRTISTQPQISEPLLQGDTETDARGVLIYGSVIRDGGIFRMWYQARPQNYSGRDVVSVGYAESDDGLNWRKPKLGLVNFNGSTANNLVNLPLHSATVFVDPTSPCSHRYRATGFSQPKCSFEDKPVALAKRGYYTAHSSDGLCWEFDGDEPRWEQGDVITSCWDEFNNSGYVAMKRMVHSGGINRRCIANAVLRDGEYSDARATLIPDDFDDMAARRSGGIAGDYYGMGWVPAEDMTFGLLWNFRMEQPMVRTTPEDFRPQGLYGQVDLSVIWRESAQDVWRHLPGRPSFVSGGDPGDWYSGILFTASQAVRVGDEDWMYCGGGALRHGDFMNTDWRPDEMRFEKSQTLGGFRIGVMRWKAGRLMGLHAPLYDELEIALPPSCAGKQLRLNMQTWGEGSILGELVNRSTREVVAGFSREDCIAARSDDISYPLVWSGQSTLPAVFNSHLALRLCLNRAAVYGFEVKAESNKAA